MNNEFESLKVIVGEINMHRQKGSITASEMEFVESRIPEVISLTPNGLFALHILQTPEITEIQPEAPFESVKVTCLEPETISDSQNDTPLREKTIPPNRSLNGRHLEIIPREQNFLAAIRRGTTQAEILNTIYLHLPLQKAISQMLNDAQHLRDLLQLNGCNLLMHSGPEGYSFEEVINEPKPSSIPSGSSFANKRPQQKETPIVRQPTPPESPLPQPPESGEGLNESNLLPTEVIAFNAIRTSFPESPLGAGKWLAAINSEREKTGARPLGIYDLEGLISSIKEATGISIQKVTHHNKDFYYRERRRGRKP